MKKLLTLAFLLMAAPSFADSNNRVAFKLFGVQPNTKIAAQGSDYDGSMGPGFGLEYLRRVNEYVSVGGEFDSLMRSELQSNTLLTGVDSKVSGSLKTALVMARLDITPDNKVIRPYVSGGIGLGIASLRGEGTPRPGFQWNNGGNDTRVLIDDSKTAFAFTVRAGADVLIGEHLTLGGELGLVRTASVTHGLTSQGQGVLGPATISGSESNIIFGGAVGYRF